jgi:predicted Zn-dependent peptidase
MNLTHLVTFSFYEGAWAQEVAPPPPPPTPAVQAFGGGPFWRRYGYDEAYDDIREAAEEEVEEISSALTEKRRARADDAINAAAGAMLRNESPAIVNRHLDAYLKVIRVQKGLRTELKHIMAVRRAFKAAVARKLRMSLEMRQKAENERRMREEEESIVRLLFSMAWD